MNRNLRWMFILAFLLIFGSLPAMAQGVIVPPRGVETNAPSLLIDYLRVNTTIDNQIAQTNIDMQFTNTGELLAEGTYLFPLPAEAAVDELIMYIDGEAIEAKILGATEAREVYNEIVRQLADPALLEYVGMNAIQANVFPIPPGESRRIEITYTEILTVDNGLVHYQFPMHSAGNNGRVVGQVSFSVDATSNEPISNVYSPSHRIALSRESETAFRAGYEANNVVPQGDFSLYYGIANENININLLTYRESADQDGFFMLLVQPPNRVPEDQILPKDVIIVLDQSGSMEGDKWEQAQEAAKYILDNLNPADRFNVIPFSTGWRMYANGLAPADDAQGAMDWIDSLIAEGGTDINGALTNALNLTDSERSTTILFLTDGLATEGITETSAILTNLSDNAKSNARIFTFGVGDDVDTFLLDAIVRDFNGTGSYVRPNERIDEEVASLYNKISSPVLTNVTLEIDGVVAELMYPKALNDLFAGEQITLVGRYRGFTEGSEIRLNGIFNGIPETYIYTDQNFRENAGGEGFIPRLWATRRIGDLLNTIRLNGESQELVDAVVDLSIRYGIITPYTSFLIEEDDILSQLGRERAQEGFANQANELANTTTGADAVAAADASIALSGANAPAEPSLNSYRMTEEEAMDEDGEFDDGALGGAKSQINPIQTVGDKTFILQGEIWTDTTFEPDTMETEKIVFLSDDYFDLITEMPALTDYFAIGDQVIVVIDGTAYEVVPE